MLRQPNFDKVSLGLAKLRKVYFALALLHPVTRLLIINCSAHGLVLDCFHVFKIVLMYKILYDLLWIMVTVVDKMLKLSDCYLHCENTVLM